MDWYAGDDQQSTYELTINPESRGLLLARSPAGRTVAVSEIGVAIWVFELDLKSPQVSKQRGVVRDTWERSAGDLYCVGAFCTVAMPKLKLGSSIFFNWVTSYDAYASNQSASEPARLIYSASYDDPYFTPEGVLLNGCTQYQGPDHFSLWGEAFKAGPIAQGPKSRTAPHALTGEDSARHLAFSTAGVDVVEFESSHAYRDMALCEDALYYREPGQARFTAIWPESLQRSTAELAPTVPGHWFCEGGFILFQPDAGDGVQVLPLDGSAPFEFALGGPLSAHTEDAGSAFLVVSHEDGPRPGLSSTLSLHQLLPSGGHLELPLTLDTPARLLRVSASVQERMLHAVLEDERAQRLVSFELPR
ncbi:MAG: hypothetical protein QM756_25465 [Polyangiaceae bacterium]